MTLIGTKIETLVQILSMKFMLDWLVIFHECSINFVHYLYLIEDLQIYWTVGYLLL